MGEIRENLKKNLGYYLSLNNMSQKQLAERLNVSPAAVTNWIKGKNSPDIEIVAQICDIFNISIMDLMGKQLEKSTNVMSKNAHEVAKAYDLAEPRAREAARFALGLAPEKEQKAFAADSMVQTANSFDDIRQRAEAMSDIYAKEQVNNPIGK